MTIVQYFRIEYFSFSSFRASARESLVCFFAEPQRLLAYDFPVSVLCLFLHSIILSSSSSSAYFLPWSLLFDEAHATTVGTVRVWIAIRFLFSACILCIGMLISVALGRYSIFVLDLSLLEASEAMFGSSVSSFRFSCRCLVFVFSQLQYRSSNSLTIA